MLEAVTGSPSTCLSPHDVCPTFKHVQSFTTFSERCWHQRNAESVSMKLGVPGSKKHHASASKRFRCWQSASSASKLAEAWTSAFFLTGPPYRQQIWVKWTTLVLITTTNPFNGTLHETLGEHIGALLWIADFHPIAPNRLEARMRTLSSPSLDLVRSMAGRSLGRI